MDDPSNNKDGDHNIINLFTLVGIHLDPNTTIFLILYFSFVTYRNWSVKWGTGASKDPCSNVFRGSKPFSEKETQGMRDALQREAPIDLFITFHSYGKLLLYPWGWTEESPDNERELRILGSRFVEAVRYASKGNISYTMGSTYKDYGMGSGTSDDWAYGNNSVPYSYTIELPDDETHGFLLPESRIKNTLLETAIGIYCMGSYIANVGYCAESYGNSEIYGHFFHN